MTSAALEILAPVVVARSGRLDPAAVGWSRHALQQTPLVGPRGRRKRWEHWAIAGDGVMIMLTLADLDYLGAAVVAVADLETGVWSQATSVVAPGAIRFPDAVHGADLALERRRMRARVVERPGSTRIEVDARPLVGPRIVAALEISRPPAHETLNVVVPWSDRRFAFTSKQVALEARGEIACGPKRWRVGHDEDAWATLDHGRGVWPWRTRWNWGCAATRSGGRVIGLNLGAQWTDGTGQTENGVVVDGRLHKIHDAVRFGFDPGAPASRRIAVAGRGVELSFAPLLRRRVKVPLGLVGFDLDFRIGHWRGTIEVEGETLALDDALGTAEEVHARW